MSHEKLSALLAQLHDELRQAEHLDADTRSQLEEAAAELDTFLAAAKTTDEHGAFETIRDRLLSLEVEHPRVAAIVGEAADLISKLGV